MTNLEFPAYMLAWKTSSKVKCMEDVPASDSRRTEEEDRLSKVAHYWKAHDQERTQRELRFCELLDAEEAAASQKWSEEAAQALKKVKEEEKAKEKEKEKEKEKGKKKEKEVGPSGSAKGKAKEVPKMPKKPTPKKSKRDVYSESEEEEEEDKLQSCIYCVKKKIPCVPQTGKKVCVTCAWHKMRCEFFDKTTWAVKEGSEKVAEAVRELTKLERCQTASLLEKSWYDLDICTLNLEQMVDRDLMEADGKVLTLLDMKSRGVEIPPEVEKRIMTNRGSIVVSYTTPWSTFLRG
ncbi:hypothetical protein M422DRAFT_245388 [Sphaerobolus stellatus SS14]|nr:hypothetical protein M422DRAFT_245388 [Sphaerobolus stellatus SS14]